MNMLTKECESNHDFASIPFQRRPESSAAFLKILVSRLILGAVLATALPALALAQSNPLNNAYQPSINCTSADYPANVALSSTLAKLQQQAGSPSTVAGSAPCITFYAVQNEFQSFQVHVQAPSGGYSALNVTMSALSKTTGPGGNYTIPAPSSTAADIVVYREAYIDVTPVTASGSPTFYGTTGYYPDPLIPAIDPYYHQTTAAFPVTVVANQNQSAWIDVYVPQAAPSGWYLGSVTIANSGTTITTMPVLLGVWQWPSSHGGYMPSTPTLQNIQFAQGQGFCSQVYNTGGYSCSSYSNAGGNADLGEELQGVDLDVQLFDNRLSRTNNNPDFGAPYASVSTFATYEGGLESGTSVYTGISRIMAGSKGGPYGQGYGGPCLTYGTPGSGSECQTVISNYTSGFSTHGWLGGSANSGGGLIDWIVDEPGTNCSNWTNPITWAGYSRGYSTPNIPILITANLYQTTLCGGLNTVDIMVTDAACIEWPTANDGNPCGDPSPGSTGAYNNARPTYSTWLSGNCCSGSGPTRQLWRYLACIESGTCANDAPGSNGASWPNYDADGVPIANRAEEWMTFRQQQTGELYYDLNGAFFRGDPWSSIYFAGGWGDGTLVYPGSNSTHTTLGAAQVGVSTPIWIPSIRLKMMRDGYQDYEYLYLLNSLGGASATLVTNEISSWITNGYEFNPTTVPSSTIYFPDPQQSVTFTGDLPDARYALGTAIHQLSYTVVLQPPTNLTATVN